MTFRDDQDAMLARAEALDREVKRLEEENAALQKQAAEAEHKRALAESVAAKTTTEEREQREALEALAAKAPKPKPKPAVHPGIKAAALAERDKRRALRHAFTPWWFKALLAAAGVVSAFLVYIVSANFLVSIGLPFPPLVGIPFAALLGACFGIYVLAGNWFIRSTHRWIERLPFAMDPKHYVDRMGTRFTDRLEVLVDIPTTMSEADRELVRKAVLGGMPGATASWHDKMLHLASPPLKYRYSSKGGGYVHNAKHHRWFRKLVRRVLRRVHATHRIAEVCLAN